MRREYSIPDLLSDIVGYRGLPYPGALFPNRPGSDYKGGDFEVQGEAPIRQERTKLGSTLWKQDWRGRWYFMPVVFKHTSLGEVEIPHALISITGQKNIVETQLVGRKGSVKELINIDDYKISIAGFIQSKDGTWPEDDIARMRDLYNVNESVDLLCALTDLIFDEDDRVVITNIEFPATPGIEDGQVIRIECTTDKPFELVIE
jgi:hypothetical protein